METYVFFDSKKSAWVALATAASGTWARDYFDSEAQATAMLPQVIAAVAGNG